MKYGHIGITGITSVEESLQILRILPEKLDRQIVFEVLASPETLAGERQSNIKRYPDLWSINDIFLDDRRIINSLLYETNDFENLYYDLLRIMEFADTNLDILRIDAGWPDPTSLERFHNQYPHINLGIQIGREGLFEVQYDSLLFRRRIGEYAEAITDLTINSHPYPFHPSYIRNFLREIVLHQPSVQIAIGGLCTKSIDMLPQLLETFSNISVSGYQRLRNDTDTLDMWKVSAFIGKAMDAYDMFNDINR